jgi:hypothetical protein
VLDGSTQARLSGRAKCQAGESSRRVASFAEWVSPLARLIGPR